MAYFSILIPACNMQGRMEKCISSVLSQSFEDFEAIIVDDGSKDETWKELKEFEKRDGRIRAVRHKTNQSLLAARYTGMENAEGEYIFFLDSDDYLDPDTLLETQGYLKENRVDLLRFGYQTEPDGHRFYPEETDDPLRFFLEGKTTPSAVKNCYSKGLIKEVLEKTRPFYCNMSEDVYFSCLFFTFAKTTGKIHRIFYHYVTGQGMSNGQVNVSAEKTIRDQKKINITAEHILAFMEEYNPDYRKEALNAVRTMKRFLLVHQIMFEDDYCKVLDGLKLFDIEGYREVYQWGCRIFLPYMIKARLKRKDPDCKDISLPDHKIIMQQE